MEQLQKVANIPICNFLWYIFTGAVMALGAILVFVNIFIDQKLMGWFTKKTA